VHLAWVNTTRKEGGLGQTSFPLIADVSHSLARDYGVYLQDEGIALRGLFIIDKKGIIRHITINDLPVGRSVGEGTLRLSLFCVFNGLFLLTHVMLLFSTTVKNNLFQF